LIFLLSPFRVRGKKAEKSDLQLICQSRITKHAKLINRIFGIRILHFLTYSITVRCKDWPCKILEIKKKRQNEDSIGGKV